MENLVEAGGVQVLSDDCVVTVATAVYVRIAIYHVLDMLDLLRVHASAALSLRGPADRRLHPR